MGDSPINATVEKIGFYEGGMDETPYGASQYRVVFEKSSTRYVWWELMLDHPNVDTKQQFVIDAVWHDPQGRVIERHFNTAVEKDWPDSAHGQGVDWDESGQWGQGKYRVEL